MKIIIKYRKDKKKILVNFNDQECELAELALAIMFGKEEQTIEKLGYTQPDVLIAGESDEKLDKEVRKFKELLDKFYEDYYKRH